MWLTMVRSCQEPGLRPGTRGRVGAACHNEGSLATVCRGRAKEPEPAAQLAGGPNTVPGRAAKGQAQHTLIPPRNCSILHLGEAGSETKAGAKTLSRTRVGSATLTGSTCYFLLPWTPSAPAAAPGCSAVWVNECLVWLWDILRSLIIVP